MYTYASLSNPSDMLVATTMDSSPISYKKATAALDEAAMARLRGPFFGSTTPPAGREDVDDDSLVELVDEFYNGYGEDADPKESAPPRAAAWIDTLRAALADATADAAASRIRAEAERAVVDARTTVAGGEGVRKRVAERLRARGFDGGICRSSWERSSSSPAGSHEYVDVVLSAGLSTSRYIVEVNVAAEFETARPSAEYQELLLALPPVLVATPEAFKEVAAVMCAAAAESIRGAGMHVPPWRRARYVQAKWSGKYKRVAAAVAAPTGPPREGAFFSSTTAADARRRRSAPSGGPKNCAMEIGRMEIGREGLVGTRPLMFRGL